MTTVGPTAKVLLLFAATVAAFWISAIAGGGASMVLIPLLNMMLPVAEVPLALTIGTFSSSASRVAVFRQHISWRVFAWFVPFSIPAVLLGAWLIKYANPLYLQVAVGVFLVSNLPELFRSRSAQIKEEAPHPRHVLGLIGFLAGFVSGITGAVGLLFNRFYLRQGLSKEQIVATRAANEILLHTIKLGIYIALGLYSTQSLLLGVMVALGAIGSSITVNRILPYISELLFRRIGYGTMVVAGVVLLTSSARDVIATDRLHMHTRLLNEGGETAVYWRNSALVLEYTWDDGLEIEFPVTYADLPAHLQAKHDSLAAHCDRVQMEIVHRFRRPVDYEFYCSQNGQIQKLEFDGAP
jgi:uncharacterized membrane protein YfcA